MSDLRSPWTKFKKTLRISASLAKANFILRTEGSYLGIVWYILKPLALFVIILLIKKVAFAKTTIDHYPLYLLIGVTGWNFFNQVLSSSINIISSNDDYLKSINHIAPEVLVISGVLQSAFSHVFELALIIGLMIYWQVSLVGLLFYPVLFFFFILLVLGISFLFATIGVYVSDLDNIWPIVSQLLFLITPIFYVISVKDPIYIVNLFNPLFYFLTIARSLIIHSALPSQLVVLIMVASSLGVALGGWLIFNKYKKKFAELI